MSAPVSRPASFGARVPAATSRDAPPAPKAVVVTPAPAPAAGAPEPAEAAAAAADGEDWKDALVRPAKDTRIQTEVRTGCCCEHSHHTWQLVCWRGLAYALRLAALSSLQCSC